MATKKKALTKRELTGRLKSEPVEHPSGGVIYAREMTVRDLRLFQEAQASDDGDEEVLATLVVNTAVDENGDRIFGDDDADREAVRDLSLRFLLDYQAVVLEVSGMSDGGTEDEADAEDDSGNSETDRSES